MSERKGAVSLSASESLEQIRSDNRMEAIFSRYEAGEELPPGRLAKILHKLPEAKRNLLRQEIASAQSEYWSEWAPYRCGLQEEGKVVFEDMISLMPAKEEFVRFVGAGEGDLIVDLMGGAGHLARLFEGKGLAGYVIVDNNPYIEGKARSQLESLSFPHKEVLMGDLTEGIPTSLSRTIKEIRPRRVRYISNWGLTYLDADAFLRVVRQCFNPSFNHGVESILDLNMITNGKFDKDELRRKFMMVVIPRELLHLRVGRLKKSFPSLKVANNFAETWPLVMPIWYPDEIQGFLEGAGMRVQKVDTSLLWGQSTGIKVTAR